MWRRVVYALLNLFCLSVCLSVCLFVTQEQCNRRIHRFSIHTHSAGEMNTYTVYAVHIETVCTGKQ